MEQATYVGSSEHKAQRWWGGLPQARIGKDSQVTRPKKQKTTICTLVDEADRQEATRWVKLAIRSGQCRFYEGDKDFPKHIWYYANGQIWFGYCINSVAGQYKGWPIEEEERPVRFSAEWSNDALNAAPEERVTVADLQVWVGDQNVTMHLIDDENENHLTMPLYSLAEGLIHDWWILFGGRDREVSFVKYRMGYAVPDVRMKFDGAAFEVTAHQYAYKNPNVRFWAGPSEVLSRTNAEHTLDELIESVLRRLDESAVHNTSAALRWARVRESRTDPEEVVFCEAAGALGLDPYQIDDAKTAVIEAAANFFNGEPLSEFLAGARGNQTEPLLSWVDQVEQSPRYRSRVAELASIAVAAVTRSPNKDGERSWELGYRRARTLRSVLGLKPADRLRSYRSLAEKLGASKQFKLAPRVDGIRALRSDKEDGVHIYLRNHGSSPDAKTGEMFTFTRAVGDVVCFPAASRSPVNELHDAFRQAAGRAFAAEFLAPIEEILSMRQDGRDIQSVADEFSVATAVVERQLENTERIAKACA